MPYDIKVSNCSKPIKRFRTIAFGILSSDIARDLYGLLYRRNTNMGSGEKFSTEPDPILSDTDINAFIGGVSQTVNPFISNKEVKNFCLDSLVSADGLQIEVMELKKVISC